MNTRQFVELAPRNKHGLAIQSPLIAGAGSVGYGDGWPVGLDAKDFGAFVTAPISMQPHRGSPQPRLAEIAGGYILATSDHNPGFRRVVKGHAHNWQHAPCPVLVSLAGGGPGDRVWMANQIDSEAPWVAGLEIPVAEDVNLSETSAFISSLRHATTLPILVKLPVTRAAYLAEACVVAGADALVIGTPPPALFPAADGVNVAGAIGGPIALAFSLRALHYVHDLRLEAPLIASGGIYSLDDVALCLDAGTAAVQVRGLVWSDPGAAATLAQSAPALIETLPVEEQGTEYD